jgi:hypothetical protein
LKALCFHNGETIAEEANSYNRSSQVQSLRNLFSQFLSKICAAKNFEFPALIKPVLRFSGIAVAANKFIFTF